MSEFLKLDRAAARVARETGNPEFDIDSLRLELARGNLHACFWHDGWLGVFDAKPGALARPAGEISVPLNKRTASRVCMFTGHLCSLTFATVKDFYQALTRGTGNDSPFENGTASNRGSLIDKATSKPLTYKNLQNNMHQIRAASKVV